VRPTTPQTQVALVEGDDDQPVRLDRGGVYLEMDPLAGVEATVHTPFGVVSAEDARCYISCLDRGDGKMVLAVLVLDGQVEVKNGHGAELAEAGELILAPAGQSPDRAYPVTLAPEDQDWAQAQEVLHLLGDPNVHEQLKLDLPQKDRLTLPTADEDHQVEDFL